MQPFDDRARYHRPAALIASTASGRTAKGDPIVEIASAQDWLDRKAPPESHFSEADQAMFRAAGIRPPRKG